ncbi:NAD(P)H-binding protein [Spiractinospora alimapuensis]|uniref:NmrA family NAD(P)-binding protein n=1 Tax=Spiractinospora alimapuensis TaxID=2820884 RepID=UPI001F1B694E|nr:NAD(P)H-binding protein [Spiractinospora alimapuensis]QVQ51279.1 NAD(P)H-binding protein [Spiractinospora alimapuensis]
MTILITGGTGNTGRPITDSLRSRGADVRVAARRPGPNGVPFDWTDHATHARALAGANVVYLVPPPMNLNPMPAAGPFLEAARAAGVRRVVLLSSLLPVHDDAEAAELTETVRSFPEWAVLLPSGFMQNFTGAHPLAAGIREHGEIRSATGTGKVGWIDAADIASAAAEVLTAPGPVAGEHVLTGPEPLGYSEAAAIIAEVAGRPVRHISAPVSELLQRNAEAGIPEPFAAMLAEGETAIAKGHAARVTDTVHRLTGRPPRSFADFVRARPKEWSAA